MELRQRVLPGIFTQFPAHIGLRLLLNDEAKVGKKIKCAKNKCTATMVFLEPLVQRIM